MHRQSVKTWTKDEGNGTMGANEHSPEQALRTMTFDVSKERTWSWSVALMHGKNACEVVEKDTDVADVVVAVTLEDVQWNSRCALVPECM
ncbi:hypothetical protein D1007_11388 [Hordeum vulgare]|nr:hypothetical protein D1007_11388 [Hordeum vulgare]